MPRRRWRDGRRPADHAEGLGDPRGRPYFVFWITAEGGLSYRVRMVQAADRGAVTLSTPEQTQREAHDPHGARAAHRTLGVVDENRARGLVHDGPLADGSTRLVALAPAIAARKPKTAMVPLP